MKEITAQIAKIGIVPVIKLNNPHRDAAPLAQALRQGQGPADPAQCRWQRLPSGPRGQGRPSG